MWANGSILAAAAVAMNVITVKNSSICIFLIIFTVFACKGTKKNDNFANKTENYF